MELPTILTIIDGCGGRDSRTKQGALVVGDAFWIGAGSSRFHTWVSLHVDVEGCADIRGVTKLLAFDRIIGPESKEPEVGVGVYGCFQVLKRPLVSGRGRCFQRDFLRTN